MLHRKYVPRSAPHQGADCGYTAIRTAIVEFAMISSDNDAVSRRSSYRRSRNEITYRGLQWIALQYRWMNI
jgi:hypothetical protein